MRTLLATFLALLVLLSGAVSGPALHAEEEAADGPTGFDAETHWFARLLEPSEAWDKLSLDLREVPGATRRAEQARRVEAYVKAWEAAGKDLTSLDVENVEALLRFYTVGDRYEAAHETIASLLDREGLEVAQRDSAMRSWARLLANRNAREALGEERTAELLAHVRGYIAERAGEGSGPIRGDLHQILALYAGASDDDESAIRHYMLAALADPSKAAAAGRSVLRSLQGSTHSLEGYPVLRQTAAAVVPVFQQLAAENLASVKASGAEGRPLLVAERSVALLENAGKPLDMLGREPKAWTLEHAFGDVSSLEDVKGKVVLLDFWATWCPWCIRSFPAIRDLLRDYADKGLAVVGVTASASSVYDQRYDLDDDLKEKAGGERVRPVARLARDGTRTDGTPPSLPEEEFREVERQAIERFIANHEMTWPVVMIDKAEPSAKFALSGWPHAVVLDRQGRIRYFKVGALLRDREEQVAAFRAVLDDLLAEEGAE